MTAISFGARANATGWRNAQGEWCNPALVDIIRNTDERQRFLACQRMAEFLAEQRMLDDHLLAQVRAQWPELLQNSAVLTPKGKVSRAKVVAYLYQHAETDVMQLVRDMAIGRGRTVLAKIHDAICLRQRLGNELKADIEYCMQQSTGNPYWRLAEEPIKRYDPRVSAEYHQELQDHQKRMQDLERVTQSYISISERQELLSQSETGLNGRTQAA